MILWDTCQWGWRWETDSSPTTLSARSPYAGLLAHGESNPPVSKPISAVEPAVMTKIGKSQHFHPGPNFQRIVSYRTAVLTRRPCCPRAIRLPLTASPCGRFSRPRLLPVSLTSTRSSHPSRLIGSAGPTSSRLNRMDLPCSRPTLWLHAGRRAMSDRYER